tara:strand:+ start:205 stop:516 length:312 start_codon:yes stop_codon:yes gene_type:complete
MTSFKHLRAGNQACPTNKNGNETMPNFIDDRHWGLLAFFANKARSGKLKDANITVGDVDLIITAIQDRDRVIRELRAEIKILNGKPHKQELKWIRNGFVDHYR